MNALVTTLAATGSSSKLDWYLTRSTGAVALLLLTGSLALGVADVQRLSTPRWPRFVVDSLHRNISLLALAFLVLHILTAVLDSFAPISLTAAFVPFISSYRPLWLGLGAVAFDLMLAIIFTWVWRQRIGHRGWRATHWCAYACWPIALLHSFGTGSDSRDLWLQVLTVACLALVVAAVLARTLSGWSGASARSRSAAIGGLAAFTLGLLVWLPAGPLGAEWARRSGIAERAPRPSELRLTDDAERSMSPSDPGLPRLLAGIPEHGALSLREHRATHGELPVLTGRKRSDAAELIEQVELAGLRGRGGGGFPAGAKLRAVAEARGRPVVLVNAAEAEPASFKDRTLLQALPHLVLDGAELAARAVGSDEIVIGICDTATEAIRSVADALAERAQDRARRAPRARLAMVPNRYVSGQESALVNHVNGGPAIPTFTPPLPFERGVSRRPTLIGNVETLAHMALIARHGPEWFRELGIASQPGSALVTLSGTQLAYPGVYEIEIGSPLTTLLEAAGGLDGQLRAMLVGGYAGAWVDGGLLRDVALSDEHLAPYGASLGAGVIVLLSSEACPVAELTRLTRWLAAQSARQCGPCVFGLDAIASTMEQLTLGAAGPSAQQRLASLSSLVRGRGACSHPDGVARLVTTALEVFAEELSDHARHGPCAGCERPSELPRPRAGAASPSAPAHSAHELVGTG